MSSSDEECDHQNLLDGAFAAELEQIRTVKGRTLTPQDGETSTDPGLAQNPTPKRLSSGPKNNHLCKRRCIMLLRQFNKLLGTHLI